MSILFTPRNSANYLYVNDASTYFGLPASGAECAHTILMWAKVRSDITATGQRLFAAALSESTEAFGAAHGMSCINDATTSNREVSFYSNSGSTACTATDWVPGDWMCLIYQRTVSGASGTINAYWATAGDSTFGQSNETGQRLSGVTVTRLTVGRYDSGGSGYGWDGSIAAVRVWDHALNSAERIAELTATSVAPVKSTGLLLDYQFATGALTTDSSGNGFTLSTGGSGGTFDSDVPSTWSAASTPTMTLDIAHV